jgi:hypothetical protein
MSKVGWLKKPCYASGRGCLSHWKKEMRSKSVEAFGSKDRFLERSVEEALLKLGQKTSQEDSGLIFPNLGKQA